MFDQTSRHHRLTKYLRVYGGERCQCVVYGKSHWDKHCAGPGLLQWKKICLLKNADVLLGPARDRTCQGDTKGVVNLHVNLVRLWCLDVWSNISLDVSLKVFFRWD